MITRITGQLVGLSEEAATLRLGGLEYEVLIPEYTRRNLQNQLGREVSLHTIEYIEGNPMQGRLTPRLLGFLQPEEREFFELFCSVDGVGIRKALRAMVHPVPDLATAIENKDTKFLATLPGIGSATADRIVAKLHRKVSVFAVTSTKAAGTSSEIVRETLAVLVSLGHSEAEARRLVDRALATGRQFPDVQSLIETIYTTVHKPT
ncbi:MAG: helix-hairpin-helix domain-containing protein [Thermoguttaceae bacterium]|nr:helix-hairpin-helix domain-containing protein [Thermoguttaceae bacterium]MDW8077479.1 Holliday junction branch migration protein RuvA [Thermoguttaceae bacterium]